MMEKEVKEFNTAQLVEEERGAEIVEYVLLIALIAVICITALTFLGEEASTAFVKVGTHIGTSTADPLGAAGS